MDAENPVIAAAPVAQAQIFQNVRLVGRQADVYNAEIRVASERRYSEQEVIRLEAAAMELDHHNREHASRRAFDTAVARALALALGVFDLPPVAVPPEVR